MSVLEQIYERSPIVAQNLFCTVYGVRQQRQLYGPSFQGYYESFLANERRPGEELRALQLHKLRAMLGQAFAHVPYYRSLQANLKLNSDDLSWDDFYQFPLLEKEVLRANSQQFLSDENPNHKTLVGRTSGTTGTPLIIISTHEAASQVWAAMERLRHWAGVSRHDRRASLTGKVFVPTSRDPKGTYWRHDWAGKRVLLSVYHLSPNTVASYVEELRRFRPTFIDGYPSAIAQIATYLKENPSLRIPSLRAAFPTAETLTPGVRKTIEEGLGVEVRNQYGSTETACHAGECEHGNLHISPEIGIVEILNDDGSPTPPNQVGNLVLTGLVNTAMPLIRYKIGDTAIAPDPHYRCACGRSLPVMGHLAGRNDDLVRTKEGQLLPIMNYHVFKWAKGIKEAQLIQEAFDAFTFVIVPEEGQSPQLDQSLQELETRMGGAVKVNIEYVDEIDRTSRGKFRGVISKV